MAVFLLLQIGVVIRVLQAMLSLLRMQCLLSSAGLASIW
jgi:hypothetical protein